ncbi:nicotinate-nucleotide--dimethylbenzimidazole phosphoribosyltransferase [Halomonas sp. GD1P12]|uniref:nicotinate-nucleotide--dimethylbenzimidazole phosphoribosyltransferase n=1 Tax=Halomonas sp. GD1P12 TaxID=2982691 RepID=UPI0021E48F80|nr:nicotinate-nucleotide--dimethylbenzimidazole phosphoribosyltransferase [Halomonas sp. GD1P12]UYG01231.1 nicotinate-nucleotide--dimethylbenzimidazole phosphoribosyltransferase [Halomonas sp. GD1P12]
MPRDFSRITPFDTTLQTRARAYLDTLTKPPGSLGRLEDLAVSLCHITDTLTPHVDPPGIVVFAADHGVAEEGVSAFPQAVTAQMVANFAQGGAAINVFARQIEARIEVVDVGVASDVRTEGVVDAKVRHGTRNFARENAMSAAELDQALQVGVDAVERAARAGCRCLILGEMGIANTTASSAVLAALLNRPVGPLVGAGTGLVEARLAHKIDVIEKALVARAPGSEPLEVLAAVGGLELAAMAGAMLASAERRLPVVVDGFIATVAALAAVRLCPPVREVLIFSHRSAEPGHAVALEALAATPLLELNMRLGEGSGAALAFPLLKAACAMISEMATFENAGVTR